MFDIAAFKIITIYFPATVNKLANYYHGCYIDVNSRSLDR
jgi:hypothetical protein